MPSVVEDRHGRAGKPWGSCWLKLTRCITAGGDRSVVQEREREIAGLRIDFDGRKDALEEAPALYPGS
jgi:hypothetical protein